MRSKRAGAAGDGGGLYLPCNGRIIGADHNQVR